MAPTPVFTSGITLIVRQATSSTSIPQAPPAAGFSGSSRTDGFSPAAIIGIVTAIVGILVLVPLIAVILRRQQKKRCRELLPDSASGGLNSSTSSVREEQSLKSILVTREVLRSSLKVDPGMRRPEEAHTHQRGWSNTEVHGGHWK